MPFGLILRGITKMKKLSLHLKNKEGFTLIELLLYIGIFSIIISGISLFAVTILAERTKNQVIAEVNYQGEATMDLMTQTVRSATSITTPTRGNSGTSMSLVTSVAANNPTVFDSYNDGSVVRLRISEGSPATVNKLTNGRVTVSSLSFTNSSVTAGTDSIKIQFTLSAKTSSVRGEFNYQKTFYGTATRR